MKTAKTILVVSALLALFVPVASADDGGAFDLSSLWVWFVDQLDSRGGWDPNGLTTDEGGWVDPFGGNAEGGVFMDPNGVRSTDEGGFVDPYGGRLQSAPRREGSGLDPHGRPSGTQNATTTGDRGMGLDPNG